MELSLSSKSLFQSKTFWGAAVGLGASVVGMASGIDVDRSVQQNLTENLHLIATAMGSIFAMYGRKVAKSKIS